MITYFVGAVTQAFEDWRKWFSDPKPPSNYKSDEAKQRYIDKERQAQQGRALNTPLAACVRSVWVITADGTAGKWAHYVSGVELLRGLQVLVAHHELDPATGWFESVGGPPREEQPMFVGFDIKKLLQVASFEHLRRCGRLPSPAFWWTTAFERPLLKLFDPWAVLHLDVPREEVYRELFGTAANAEFVDKYVPQAVAFMGDQLTELQSRALFEAYTAMCFARVIPSTALATAETASVPRVAPVSSSAG